MMSWLALRRRLEVIGCSLLVLGLLVAGCGGGDERDGPKIALLLPQSESSFYEASDSSAFETAVEERCDGCEVLYSNAGEMDFNHPEKTAAKQQGQAEAALMKGAEALVIDPVDPKAAAAIASKAKARNVPVISYERLIENADVDAYVAVDNEKAGEVQAETLAKRLKEEGKPRGPVVMMNGDPADPRAALIKSGAKKAFNAAGVEIAREYDIPEWRAEFALSDTEKMVNALGRNGFAAISGASENIAAGANSELRHFLLTGNRRPVAGQDADPAGIQRVITDEQFMTTYRDVESKATAAAEIAIALAEGGEVPQDKISSEMSNGKVAVPSVLLEPIAITKDNVKSTVVADGFLKTDELCSFYEYACDQLKIAYSKRAPS